MLEPTREFIREQVSDSGPIFARGMDLYENGAFVLAQAEREKGEFIYRVDGNYGEYTTRVRLFEKDLETDCNCPYPGKGCKHTVAVLLDVRNLLQSWKRVATPEEGPESEAKYLSPEEIKNLAFEDRKRRARSEPFDVIEGDMLKGEHLIRTQQGKQYMVTLHDPIEGRGHCSCPDFFFNHLGTCKHLIHVSQLVRKKKEFKARAARERFPFVDVYWDSVSDRPRLFHECRAARIAPVKKLLERHFDTEGLFCGRMPEDLVRFIDQSREAKVIRIQEGVLTALNRILNEQNTLRLSQSPLPELPDIRTDLYPYQREGVSFGLYRPAVLIGDEMGLGKTLQAIVLSIMKKALFGFDKVLVVTLASLKEQWKREIERFTAEAAQVVAGNPRQREEIYYKKDALFKITNYEAVLRDVTLLSRFRPDLVILDEAQRIKNFSTKTAEAVKSIPRQHAMVLTGTPLENKLEDVYSIIQFLDPFLLSPLWRFAADHFMLSRKTSGKIIGYHSLEQLHQKIKPIVIRRRKEEVLSDLPEQLENNYYIELHHKQQKIHSGYLQALLPLLNKKYLTPVDLRRIQELLLKMRMVCNSTYLIDRKTHISPKLKELQGILDELIQGNGRKFVIFSEWTTMTFLIARLLSEANIPFVELSGKIPVKKRQALIDEFTNNPKCRAFLSTDAGGTGLNLQAADTVINIELPWNPARLNQRVGRVNRIGQKSKCVNVVNLIAKDSIEEKILAGIQLKTDLFKGVFDGGPDMVEFSVEKRTALLNRLREMMNEEPLPVPHEPAPGEEIPEDTPHYLNPQALRENEPLIDIAAEEQPGQDRPAVLGGDGAPDQPANAAALLAQQPPEKIETVLDSGMKFIGGLIEMATGQKVEATADDGRMVRIDRDTGEVTLKFKLPGF